MADLIAELADCPFCDGEAWLREETTAPKDCRHYVRCQSCGAETALQPTPEIAAEAWNTRTHHAEIAAAVRDDRQRLPRGWRIEVRENGGRLGLCIFGPDGVGAFAVDKDTDHKSDIRGEVIAALHTAMRAGEGEG